MTEQQIQEAACELYLDPDYPTGYAYTHSDVIAKERKAFEKGANWALENRWVKCSDRLPEYDAKKWYLCGNMYGNFFVDRLFQYEPNSGWWGYGDKEPDDRVFSYLDITALIPTPPKP